MVELTQLEFLFIIVLLAFEIPFYEIAKKGLEDANKEDSENNTDEK